MKPTEPQYKPCPDDCEDGIVIGNDGEERCERCEGTGEVEMTDDEVEFERECRELDEADNNE
jgi:DnaJ-class molecular chaperone